MDISTKRLLVVSSRVMTDSCYLRFGPGLSKCLTQNDTVLYDRNVARIAVRQSDVI